MHMVPALLPDRPQARKGRGKDRIIYYWWRVSCKLSKKGLLGHAIHVNGSITFHYDLLDRLPLGQSCAQSWEMRLREVNAASQQA